jgi:hypothetical protein
MSNTQSTNGQIANHRCNSFNSAEQPLSKGRCRVVMDSIFDYLKKAPKCNPQKESLFFQLPPELRSQIYELLASSWCLDTDIHVFTVRDGAGKSICYDGRFRRVKLRSFCCILEVDPRLEIKPWSGGPQDQLGCTVLPACFHCERANLAASKDKSKEKDISILTTCKRQYVTPHYMKCQLKLVLATMNSFLTFTPRDVLSYTSRRKPPILQHCSTTCPAIYLTTQSTIADPTSKTFRGYEP